jgi:hypothetical protein
MRPGPAPDRSFDPDRFVAHWRAALPTLRDRLGHFGIGASEVDDVLGEVVSRMLRAPRQPETLRDFIVYADAVARRRALAIQQRRAELRERLRTRRAQMGGPDRSDGRDEADEAERRALVDAVLRSPAFRALPKGERRAIGLMLRGGTLSNAERQLMFRTRARVMEFLEAAIGGLGGLWLWVRERLGRVEPVRSAVALSAAVVAVASVGVVLERPAPAIAVSAAAGPTARGVSGPGAGTTATARPAAARLSNPSSPTAGRLAARPVGPSGTRPVVAAGAAAKLPRPGQPGEASLGVGVPSLDGDAWAIADYNCDSAFRAVVCQVVAKAP